MEVMLRTPAAEVRIDEEDQRLGQVSTATVWYMYGYGVSLEDRLRRHRGNLRFLWEEEHDLLEVMRLTGRLNRVEHNVGRTGRRNERTRAELVRREIEGR